MTGLDTAVVIRLVIGEPPELAHAAREYLERTTASGALPCVISDLVVAESYHVLRHHYGVPHDQAIASLHQLVADRTRIRPLGFSATVLPSAHDPSLGLVDRLLHAEYAAAGAETATFDRKHTLLSGTQLVPSEGSGE